MMTNQNDNIRVPIEALHTQEFKKDRRLVFGIPTDMIAALVTAHGRNVGIFNHNEKIVIKDITVEDNYAEIDGVIYRQENN